MKKFFLALFCVLVLLFPSNAFADDITDWKIEDFQSDIVLNKNSTIQVTEKITADCGTLEGKHGIFRTLPTQVTRDNKTIKTSLSLISISDFNDKPYRYQTIHDYSNRLVTWKIGDPNQAVHGVNYYKIVYTLHNVINFSHPDFDELYLNLNGNFWQLNTDQYTARLSFPSQIKPSNSKIFLYSGSYGTTDNHLADSSWLDNNTLEVKSTRALASNKGITLSISFPKHIEQPYKVTFLDLIGSYNQLLWLMMPCLVFLLCLLFWALYGNDPKIKGPITPEFNVPGDLAPMELGMIYSNGRLESRYITAAIINLAVKGIIKIEKTEPKGLLKKDDYLLTIINYDPAKVTGSERHLLNDIFGLLLEPDKPLSQNYKYQIELSCLKNNFYNTATFLKDYITKDFEDQDFLDTNGAAIRKVMFVLAACFAVFYCISRNIDVTLPTLVSFFLTIIILICFGIVMPRRTLKQIDLYRQVLGFKLYMETAEKYPQQFNEKENLLEKFLPYAILFGLTNGWVEKMKGFYKSFPDQHFAAVYNPSWLTDINYDHLTLDSFNSQLNSLVNKISSVIPPMSGGSGGGGGGFSGFGGGGFSGGGFGGGGGGGW